MTPAQYQLLQRLSQGAQNGPALGQALGISRAAVWKQIRALRQLGVAIESHDGAYHLPTHFDLLNAERIRAGLNGPARSHCTEVEVLAVTDSTNTYLLQRTPRAGVAVFAESQRAGRGRRGRHWHSPPCSNVYFSLGWEFSCGVGALGLLSAQVAVAAAVAIESLQACPVQLKWPNDLYRDGRKLGGILIELQATVNGPSTAVIGIGLNVRMPEHAPIEQAYTSLDRAPAELPCPERNILAAALINQLCSNLAEWPLASSQSLLEQWQQRDYLAGRAICIDDGQSPIHGDYLGIDGQGGLRYRLHGQEFSCHSGEVSVRRA